MSLSICSPPRAISPFPYINLTSFLCSSFHCLSFILLLHYFSTLFPLWPDFSSSPKVTNSTLISGKFLSNPVIQYFSIFHTVVLNQVLENLRDQEGQVLTKEKLIVHEEMCNRKMCSLPLQLWNLGPTPKYFKNVFFYMDIFSELCKISLCNWTYTIKTNFQPLSLLPIV